MSRPIADIEAELDAAESAAMRAAAAWSTARTAAARGAAWEAACHRVVALRAELKQSKEAQR